MPVCALPDGAEMTYADQGAGEPVILVHGWAAHGGFFDELATRLAASCRVLTPTLRGHFGSTHATTPLTIETLGEDIAHFCAALDLKGAVALGWSMGAMAIWRAAPKLGARLAGIIVEDMGPRLINDETWAFGLAGNYGAGDVAGTLAEIDADWPAYVSRFAPRMFAPDVRDARGDLLAWAIAEMSKAAPAHMGALWASMAAEDFRAELANITQPMLVIHGGQSPVYPAEATHFIARTAPAAAHIAIPGAGHVPHLEAPDAFFQEVEAFVRERRAARFEERRRSP